jgi:acyl-coenzyme A thioesterase PaaI-like protein
MTPRSLRRIFNIWPPFLFSGIRVLDIGADWRSARVRLRQHWFSQNYVGTHFGGTLFAMTDPFWMILVMESLGSDYVVWDKSAQIDFVAARREDVFADFQVEQLRLDEIRAATAGGEKFLAWFAVEIKTAAGDVVARARKELYIRLKREK